MKNSTDGLNRRMEGTEERIRLRRFQNKKNYWAHRRTLHNDERVNPPKKQQMFIFCMQILNMYQTTEGNI